MQIHNKELSGIKNRMDEVFSSYGKGWDKLDFTKEALSEQQQELHRLMRYQESKLKSLSTPSETDRGNGIVLATSKDIGMISQSMREGIEKRNFSFAISLGNLITKSTTYSDPDRYAVKRLLYEAKEQSGFNKEQDTLNQSEVIKTELDAMLDLIGTDGYKEVLSQVNMKRSPAEIEYERNKEKAEKLRD
jgi:hypothetical protein